MKGFIFTVKFIKKNFLVVTDYNWLPDDLNESWVHQYSDNYLIYDRYHRFKENDKVKHQKNVGQNIYDIFDFILTHYDNLPETILFCRACIMWPKDYGVVKYDKNGVKLGVGSCTEETFKRLCNNKTLTELQDHTSEPWRINGHSNRIGPDNSYLELNNSWYFSIAKGKYYNNLNDFFKDMYVNPPMQEYIRFAPAANYIIPRKNILRYSKKFYERIREILSWDVIIGEAHMIERAMYTIFSCDYEVKEEYR